MILNLKYALNEIIRNIWTSILSSIQLIICFIFIYFIIKQTTMVYDEMGKITSVLGDKKIYAIEFYDELEALGNKETSEILKKFYKDIKTKHWNEIAFYNNSSINIENFDGINQFTLSGIIEENNFSWVRCITVDHEFTEQYNFDTVHGSEFFTEDDFKIQHNESIPVILGNEYKNFFDIGDIINYRNQYGGDIRSMYVLDFLEEGSIFLDEAITYNLDSYIVFPFQDIEGTIGTEDGAMFNEMKNFLEVRLLRDTLIKTSEKSNVLADIEGDIKELGLQDVVYINDISKATEDLIGRFKQSISDRLIGVLLTFIFVIIGLICNNISKIESRYLEFSIHMSYGAKIKDIFLRIFMEFIILNIVAYIFSIIFILAFAYFADLSIISILDFKSIVVLFIISIITGIIIAIPSVFKIKSNTIINLIRR